jgi:Hg(II)-responsive transcriptional regulator
MQTGEVAARAGVNIQTLRFYERRGLISKPPRSPSGYRRYSDEAVRIVRFVKRAQDLGFSLDEAAQLLRLRRVSGSRRRSVQTLATAKLAEIEAKVRQLQAIRSALEKLLTACCDEGTAECPILEALEQENRS